MTRPKPELQCRYHYDPIDRLAGCSPLGQHDTHCFYRLNRLSTEIQGALQTSWLQTPDLLLAQRRVAADQDESLLLATNAPGSVIHALSAGQQHGFAYLPYGMRHPDSGSLPLPGFNGERLDPVTGHYLLGNGYRAFNPVLMRFNSPDSLSPFGEGGVNAYAYCAGDPVNRVDPTGHAGLFSSIKAALGLSAHRSNNVMLTKLKIYSFDEPLSRPTIIENQRSLTPSLSSRLDLSRAQPLLASRKNSSMNNLFKPSYESTRPVPQRFIDHYKKALIKALPSGSSPPSSSFDTASYASSSISSLNSNVSLLSGKQVRRVASTSSRSDAGPHLRHRQR
ncbi:RHS repeat-associated core domain-containing protein [Pseudomonas ovata]|uniref:RHS repeat-associated core domain-containing protein n=1 Tax=Pseudomonas ovata TaxID=1839709 RepID=UPI000D6945A8|nr:RHS repeat-associated core domain-containing protein [Pseudomonas ovata]